jgi:hypothetical protein
MLSDVFALVRYVNSNAEALIVKTPVFRLPGRHHHRRLHPSSPAPPCVDLLMNPALTLLQYVAPERVIDQKGMARLCGYLLEPNIEQPQTPIVRLVE